MLLEKHFKALEKEHYDKLRQALLPDLPRSRRFVETLNLCSGCGIFAESTRASFFIPKDEDPLVELSGIVLALFSDGGEALFKTPTHSLAYFSKQHDAEKVHILLNDCLEWKADDYKFESISDWHIEGLKQLIQSNGKTTYMEPCPQWEKAECERSNANPEFRSKSGQELLVKKLSPRHAPLVNGHWKFHDEASLLWIKSQIEIGFGLGVFEEGSDDDNPIAWILTYRYGAMGLLRTSDKWRGQGCAKACVHALACELIKYGVTPYVYIELDNEASIQLFEKLGYARVCDAYFVGYAAA